MKECRSVGLNFQLFGAGCLVVVVLTHVCEARHIFPWMGWGLKHSAGHYLDLSSAILGLALLLAGSYLQLLEAKWRRLQEKPRTQAVTA